MPLPETGISRCVFLDRWIMHLMRLLPNSLGILSGWQGHHVPVPLSMLPAAVASMGLEPVRWKGKDGLP